MLADIAQSHSTTPQYGIAELTPPARFDPPAPDAAALYYAGYLEAIKGVDRTDAILHCFEPDDDLNALLEQLMLAVYHLAANRAK